MKTNKPEHDATTIPPVTDQARLQSAVDVLPHGKEFRFVDRLISLKPGCQATGEFTLKGSEPWLPGHFPDNPLLPGVLMVEAAAQVAGIAAQTDPVAPLIRGLKLAGLRQVKFLGTASPGDTLRVEAEVIGRLGPLVQARANAWVNGRKVLEIELTLGGDPVSAQTAPPRR